MLSLSGYQMTEKLHESASTFVYRARRLTDNQAVILKILKSDYPPPEKIAWFKREYETTRNLNDLAGVVNVYGLEKEQNRFFIVLEDFGASSLDRLKLAGQWSLTDFLEFAIFVTSILGQLHQHYIIHKDINPSNLILNTTTKQLKLIDFGISTVLSREKTAFRHPNLIEGTLAYLSPEQTGRMNRAIDYRTDFYSLGITFYELLTGQLPFSMSDPLEIVHCHIAKQPLSPQLIKSDIPQAISEIVLKLMAKNAEERYQSTSGLLADLEKCLQKYQTTGHIKPFRLGSVDVSDRFEIPQKLYGRETEIATLMTAIEDVSQGASEMMLVAGYSGIGKSALVQEIYKPLTRQQGYFITGKFDQFQRDIPYTSFIQAFQSLMRQLLTENETAHWRQKLLTVLGTNGQVIIEVIPEVEQIIGPQPAIPTLAPTEAQNRFNLVFQNFIKVFTQPEHPLVIFLDDLQWADGASLKLIQLLITAPDSHYLFLIGTYRDNEISPGHPLTLSLDEIKKANALLKTMTLLPLSLPHLTQLLTDLFHRKPKVVKPLAQLVQTKTGGNPFFINEFLKSLYVHALVTFDYKQGHWQWDLAQIQAQQITDNVVELMAAKVQKLPPETQTVLKLAACMGNQFDLEQLAIVSEKSPRDTAADLWAAIADGFVLPQSDTYKLMELEVEGLSEQVVAPYKFAHDRIQQAIYSLIYDANKQAVHLRIGRLLLRNTPSKALTQNIFDIVNQLNQGQKLIEQASEREQLAQLNLKAGKKAKASTAYQPAFNYLQVGLNLLEEDHWQRQYELALELYLEAASAAYLSTDFEEMEHLTGSVQQQAKTLLDQIKAYELKIQSEISQFKMQSAIDIALDVLEKLGLFLSKTPKDTNFLVDKIQKNLIEANKNIEELVDLPVMIDPYKLAASRILLSIFGATFVANPALFPVVMFYMVNISIKYGNPPVAAAGYGTCGTLLCGTMTNIHSGYRFGQLAVRLLDKFDTPELKSFVLHSFNSFIRHWTEPLRNTIEPLQEAVSSGIETGNLEYACYTAICYCEHRFFIGDSLKSVEQKYVQYTDLIVNTKQEYSIYYIKMGRQIVLNLQGKSVDKCHLVAEDFNEDEFLPIFIEQNNLSLLFVAYLAKTILPYFFKDYAQAIGNARLGAKYEQNNGGMIVSSQHNFYYSLALLAHYPHAEASEQTQYLKELASNQDKMKLWVHHAPVNYQHKYDLLEAEKARVLGNVVEAMALYDQAIEGARQHPYPHEEALAYERAAEFYLALGRKEIAQFYLSKAHYGYVCWGATAKVQDLEVEYSQLLFPLGAINNFKDSLLTTRVTNSHSGEMLDLATIMKASQAISGEIVLDNLLTKMMHIIIENAGAEKGFLLLPQNNNWFIQAQVDSTEVTSFVAIEQSEQVSANIIHYVAQTGKNVVLHNATIDGNFTCDPYIVKHRPKSMLCAPLFNQGKLTGILYLENNLTSGAFTTERLEVLQMLSSQATISLENALLYRTLEQKVQERTAKLKQKNQLIRQVFGRYLSDEVVETLFETKSGLSIGGERREITILTSDIRGFCVEANRLPPEQVIKITNCYLAAMTEVITEYHGTINEFMGDGILVLFGAPIVRDDDPERAVACAVAMQLAMKQVNKQLQVWGFTALEMGIGINTGEVVVGNLGSEKRTKYGVIGNEVNLTYRIESYTIGGQILISEPTLKRVRNLVKIHSEKSVKSKGIQQAITIYEVEGISGKYKLYLNKEEEVFLSLSKSIPLQYAVIKGKHVNDEQYLGHLVKLSAKGALICCDIKKDCRPEPLTNLKLNLVMPSHSKFSEDFYAKVLSQGLDENCLYISFTSSIPDKVKASLLAQINFKWTPNLSVYQPYPLLDEQNKKLFIKLNKLISLVGCYQPKDVAQIISFLETYIITHFKIEENLMKQHSYPNYQFHQAQHTRFIENFNDFKQEYQQDHEGYLYLALKIRKKLVDWFIHHIDHSDKQLGRFLKDKASQNTG